MSRPDAIDILVSHQVAALVRCGRPLEEARKEAEDIVEVLMNDLARIGLLDVYLSVALRRAKVYRLRCQGLTVKNISDRVGACQMTVKSDYRAELLRRRKAS